MKKEEKELAFDAMKDLARILGIDEKDISPLGPLALNFGERSRSAAEAHYEPKREVINLTKRDCVGRSHTAS